MCVYIYILHSTTFLSKETYIKYVLGREEAREWQRCQQERWHLQCTLYLNLFDLAESGIQFHDFVCKVLNGWNVHGLGLKPLAAEVGDIYCLPIF